MTVGNVIAILISAVALYGAFAFVKTKIFHSAQWPWRKAGTSTRIF